MGTMSLMIILVRVNFVTGCRGHKLGLDFAVVLLGTADERISMGSSYT